MRRSLSRAAQDQAAQSLVRILKNYSALFSSRHIAFYVATDGEIDPCYLLNEAHQQRRTCYLPCIKPDFHRPIQNRLLFARTNAANSLVPNRFGIPEPDLKRQQLIPAQALDLVFLPLVAFDLNGNRLGMGKGYYDRTFEFTKSGNCWHRPLLVGLAHECQKSEALVSNAWDIPLDAIVTNQKMYTFPK